MKVTGIAAVVVAALPSVAVAQSSGPTLQAEIGNPSAVKLSGSTRIRYEALDGQPRPGLPSEDELLSLRSTLFAEVDTGVVRFGGELWESRAWWERPGSPISANEVNALELVQAYIAVDFADPFGAGSRASVQAGRMTLNLGARRLVAADDYRNTTNGFTGLRADARTADGLTATAIYVLPQIRLPDDLPGVLAQRVQWDRESFDQQLWGGLVARPDTLAGATAEIGYFGFFERDAPGRPTRDRNLDTMTARLFRDFKPAQLDFEFEGMYQFGQVRTGTGATAPEQSVSAWFMHAEAGYLLPGAAKLRLSLEYERASGDKPGGDFNRFDTLFGSRRTDLAPSGIYNTVGRANISTLAVRAELAPSPRWDAAVAARTLHLAAPTDSFSTSGVRDVTGGSGSFAGYQMDARFRYWLVPGFLRAEINALYLAKGRFLETAPNAPRTGDTRYLSTAVTATF